MSRMFVCALASVAAHTLIIAAYSLPGGWSKTADLPAISFAPVAMQLELTGAGTPSALLKTSTDATAATNTRQPAPSVKHRRNQVSETSAPFGLGNPPHYYRSSDLDTRPKALNAIEPDYSARREDAYIVLRLLINDRGGVDEVKPVISDASEAEKSAIAAFKATRFSPGMRRGVPVNSEMWVELKFHASSEETLALPRAAEPSN